LGNGLVRKREKSQDAAPINRSVLRNDNASGANEWQRAIGFAPDATGFRSNHFVGQELSGAQPLRMVVTRERPGVRAIAALMVAVCVGTQSGCGSGPSAWRAPSVTRIFAPQTVVANPLVVPSSDFEKIWNKTVAVLDKYFDIESENRLSRTIRTQPQMGATLIEPWAFDSVTFRDRLEASLQTIQRVAVAHIDPAPTGGFLVKIEVYKFLEDMAKPDRQAAGRAVFYNDFPVNRVREIVGPVPAPLGWIARGRDNDLEQTIVAGIQDALFL
jgi:hypothetical protein